MTPDPAAPRDTVDEREQFPRVTLAVHAPVRGSYGMTVRFANNQQVVANHYNPDLMTSPADISILLVSLKRWGSTQDQTAPADCGSCLTETED